MPSSPISATKIFDSANEDDEVQEAAKKPVAPSPGLPRRDTRRVRRAHQQAGQGAHQGGKGQWQGAGGARSRQSCIHRSQEVHQRLHEGHLQESVAVSAMAISPVVRRDGFLKIMEKAPSTNESPPTIRRVTTASRPSSALPPWSDASPLPLHPRLASADAEDDTDVAISGHLCRQRAQGVWLPSHACSRMPGAPPSALPQRRPPLLAPLWTQWSFRLGNSAGKTKPKVGSSIWSTPMALVPTTSSSAYLLCHQHASVPPVSWAT